MRQTFSNRINYISNNIRTNYRIIGNQKTHKRNSSQNPPQTNQQKQQQSHSDSTLVVASERDPLLPSSITNNAQAASVVVRGGDQIIQRNQGNIRSRHAVGSLNKKRFVEQEDSSSLEAGMGSGRRSSSSSLGGKEGEQAEPLQQALSEATDSTESYNLYTQAANSPLQSSAGSSSGNSKHSRTRTKSPTWRLREHRSIGSAASKSQQSTEGYTRQQYYNERANRLLGETVVEPPTFLAEVPEEIYAVRKAALSVLEPLTYTWLIFAVGFSLSVVLGMSRWALLLPHVPFWFILLPAWLAHGALLYLHIKSAKALSIFIAEANENRQRPDSTDHLDRTEYLPLLQRSLKFGLKTGLLSLAFFIFEILLYLRLIHNSFTLAAALTPIWILNLCGIIDGVICKTQHFIRLLSWILLFVSMLLTVIKVDYEFESLRWRVILSPIVALLSIASTSLIYIVYGHQVGYFRLSEAQLTAGILYSMATLVCIVLVVVLGEVIPLDRPVEIETRVFVVALAPLVVALVGVGAWAVTKDEFERLLIFGGQPAVFPMKLRLESAGWTCVESKGVTSIPMFGEVSYEPLDSTKAEVELCACCACYPYEEDEDTIQYNESRNQSIHPFLQQVQAKG